MNRNLPPDEPDKDDLTFEGPESLEPDGQGPDGHDSTPPSDVDKENSERRRRVEEHRAAQMAREQRSARRAQLLSDYASGNFPEIGTYRGHPTAINVKVKGLGAFQVQFPKGYTVVDGDLHIITEENGSDPVWKTERVCSGFLFPIRSYTDVSSLIKKRHVTIAYLTNREALDGVEEFSTIDLPKQSYVTKQLAQTLGDVGIVMTREASGKGYLTSCEAANHLIIVEGYSHDRTGWVEVDGTRLFVTPKGSIGPVPVKLSLRDPEATKIFDKFSERGTLQGQLNFFRWAIERYPASIVPIYIGLAAPLNGLLDLGENIAAHLFGQSEVGKTTLALVLPGFYGPPNERTGPVIPWSSTAKGALAALGQVFYDYAALLEDTNKAIDPTAISQVLYGYVGGGQRITSSESQELRVIGRPTRGAALSTGETPLDSELSDVGALNRVVQLGIAPLASDIRPAAEAPKLTQAQISEFERKRDEHYGMVGLAWPEKLRGLSADDVRFWRDRYYQIVAELSQFASRDVKAVATLKLAREMAHEYLNFGWVPGEKARFGELVDLVLSKGSRRPPADQFMSVLADFLVLNKHRFWVPGDPAMFAFHPETPMAGGMMGVWDYSDPESEFIEIESGALRYLVRELWSRDEIKRHRPVKIVEECAAKGYLEVRGNETCFRARRVPISRNDVTVQEQPRMYHFRRSAFVGLGLMDSPERRNMTEEELARALAEPSAGS